ncbi:hypothetical protein [Loktanella sp. M215]|uniref:hypothetical protein n=1 Tax=Loktanella sp. M215 TaxID=2675431 RepID=UPI001F1EA37C|nr:hypothetical protein [Loktanella sp. M215]MCF7702469.1 hypothetical protein [Loktanella sp. M215]
MADPVNPAAPMPQDEKINALLDATAENTTKLIAVQQQTAATAASVQDARVYVQTIAKQTNWETNGKAISVILDKAMREDRAALNAAGEAAREMRAKSVEITHRVGEAAAAQKEASQMFNAASDRLLSVIEAHQEGKWRRVGVIALIGALCGAVGFFAREPANRYAVLREASAALRINASDAACRDLRGETLPSEGTFACVIWQTAQ